MFDKATLQAAESAINWPSSLGSTISRTLEGNVEVISREADDPAPGDRAHYAPSPPPTGFTSLPAEKSWEVRILNLWPQSKGLLDTIWNSQFTTHLENLRPREGQGLAQGHTAHQYREQVISNDFLWLSL